MTDNLPTFVVLPDPRAYPWGGTLQWSNGFLPAAVQGTAFQSSGDPVKASDVYSMGALMYLLVTGDEPPDAFSGSAFTQAVGAAKSMAGQPIPDDIRGILEKSLAPDRGMRFASISDLKQALSSLAHSGKYSATTFNLAFYLSNLLKKEIEGEAIEHDKESKLNVAPYLVQPAAAPSFESVTRSQRRSRLPLYAGAAVALAAIGAGGVFMTIQTNASPPPVASPPPAKPKVIPAPAAAPPPVVAATPAVDPAAEKKAFEAAVNQKLQEEMMKLQTQFNQKLQQRSKNVPASEASASPATSTVQRPVQVAEDRAVSAAALDERRLASRSEPPPATTTTAASVVPPQSQPQFAQQAPATTVSPAETNVIHDGDVIDYNDLDTPPHPLSPPHPMYPPLALRQRIESTVMVTALVSETGNVIDVKVLKGDPRFGFNDAAIRAMRATKFSVPGKNGKHVKTWFPQTINFRAGP